MTEIGCFSSSALSRHLCLSDCVLGVVMSLFLSLLHLGQAWDGDSIILSLLGLSSLKGDQ